MSCRGENKEIDTFVYIQHVIDSLQNDNYRRIDKAKSSLKYYSSEKNSIQSNIDKQTVLIEIQGFLIQQRINKLK